MPAYLMHFKGIVQGVGFRPYVYRYAREFGFDGWVRNGNDGLHIFVQGKTKAAEDFALFLRSHPPDGSFIQFFSMRKTAEQDLEDFRIIPSSSAEEPSLLLTPDLGLCDECRKEIAEPGDRRFGYVFTSCIHCGPRYSIISSLPYDRERTTMDKFEMCPDCVSEYIDPADRRFHSQINTCPNCAVPMRFLDRDGRLHSNEAGEILDLCEDWLRAGRILAIKGIGGYLLMADPLNTVAITRLRERKDRPSRPFALMYPDEKSAKGDVYMPEKAWEEFRSIQSPIVLGRLRKKPASALKADLVAPGLDRLGIMQPYTPFYELLMQRFGQPLIATSGNRSGSPIFYRDEEALSHLKDIADAFVVHERAIVTPQDDSVVAYSDGHQKRILLRRSRGFAPTYVLPWQEGLSCLRNLPDSLAMGAEMKSNFALYHKGNFYLSQYLGDLGNYETERHYQHTLQHLMGLLKARPDRVMIDAHPNYFSSRLGREMAEEWGVKVESFQHHKAHFAAVLAENNLLQDRDAVLGVIMDGTGWGEDGRIWGGEFFLYEDGAIERKAHLAYYDYLLGNKMAREPRLSAFSLLGSDADREAIKNKFSDAEFDFYSKSLASHTELQTSSMGRLFDAAASILLDRDVNSYEGEAAVRLEAAARKNYRNDGKSRQAFRDVPLLSGRELIRRLLREKQGGTDVNELALRFHGTLVSWIEKVALREEANKLAFSGGVFQNSLLVDLLIDRLGGHFGLYFHKQLSPNDESVSLGQLVLSALNDAAKRPQKSALFINEYQNN